ncbi:alpha/beta fold hydrolase [Lacisediminihabitans changchengi]|uniref:Alpha/beta hydrolase n=1 Tax=Lacisediminihabitans changchengi TaxID=2787634 RepID=A0A934SJ61_9MICO|nr:alpha/beta hydrolase [Lacisediminihabitans changchengi]MBK4346558.1 alpha/beta hydrolase [Lacisediminihabitans changchengi]
MTAVPGYGPFELHTDPSAFGLVTTTVSSDLGSCVARHPPARQSTIATVFLHGAAGSWTTWTPLLLAAREDGVDLGETVLLDLPGWGSATLAAHADQTVLAISTLVRDVVFRLGYTEWRLVGHSLGGFVALHMAATWPERTRDVGLVSGTTFSVMRTVEHPLRRFGQLPGFVMLWRVMQVLAPLGASGRAFVRGVDRIGLLRLATSPLFRHPFRVPRSQIDALAHELRPRSFSAAARATRAYPAEALWGAISCPVRALKGDRDVFVSPSDLDQLGRLLPHSVHTVIPDCGHFGPVERPREVLAALGFAG